MSNVVQQDLRAREGYLIVQGLESSFNVVMISGIVPKPSILYVSSPGEVILPLTDCDPLKILIPHRQTFTVHGANDITSPYGLEMPSRRP